MPMSSVNPFDHACDLDDLDYSMVDSGYIRCTTCPREWNLRPIDHGAVWVNSATCRMPGGHGPHFWTSDLKPYPKPTAEQILADRAKRLDMLDQKAAERRQMFQDAQAGWEWLEKERAKEAGPTGLTDHEWLASVLGTDSPAFPAEIVSLPRKWRIRIVLHFASTKACGAILRKMLSS